MDGHGVRQLAVHRVQPSVHCEPVGTSWHWVGIQPVQSFSLKEKNREKCDFGVPDTTACGFWLPALGISKKQARHDGGGS